MRPTTMLMLGLSLVMAPPGLAAQEPQPTSATAEGRIAATLETAVDAGVPVELLESKIEEGRAKQIPAAGIATAVEARLSALLRARETMERSEIEDMTAGDLSIAADALQAGVSEEALATLQTTAPRERRAVAVAALAALVELGNTPDAALAQVQAALSSGPEALADLRARSVIELGAGGGAPPVDLDAAGGLEVGVGIGGRPDGG